ncbi:hypothetical protein GR11A_00079 [Vibrio phage vB_VcorM_GR11A]|nr:hypothetical protein GR11A_00079 [Vibrio phage vB_VcorM_GR11A]
MTAPKVTVQERDLSTTVPQFPGVSGYINLPGAVRGNVDEAVLVTSEADFLQKYTVNDRVGVGYDLAYYSALNFLQKSTSLWVTRTVNGALYGGLIVPKSTSDDVVAPIASGIAIPSTYVFTTDDLFLIYGANPGAWNNAISIKIDRNTTEDPAINPFRVLVYHLNVLVETWTVSRHTGAKDGFGNNIYIQDVLEGSNYIRVLDNTTLPTSEIPKTTEPTTISFNAITASQDFAAATNAVTKQQSFSISQGNTTGIDVDFVLAGVTVTIPSTAITAELVATTLAAANYAATAAIASVTSVGNVVTIESTEAAGDYALPALPVPETITTSNYTVEQVSTGTDKKIVSFTVTAGNTSGQVEEFELAGVTTNVAATATLPATVAAAIAAATYTGVTTIESVTASGAKVTITFTLAAGDAAIPAKTIPTTIRTSAVGVTREFVAAAAAVPEIQTLTVNTGNSSGFPETITVAGVSIIVAETATTPAAVATAIAAEDFSSVSDINTVNAVGANVNFTMTTAAGNAADIVVDDGSRPYGIFVEKGDDGAPVTDSDLSLSLSQIDGRNITLVLDGGRATPGYQKALISLCENRQDCVAILSTPFATEASSNYINDILEYRNISLNANTSYAALYTPHVKILDKFNDRQIYVAPDGFVGAVVSQTASQYELWYPPAGFRRGVLNVLDTRRRFSEGELDVLYDAGINPIRFAPGRGIVIWGQKTLLSRPSTLNRLSARLLLIVVEPAVKVALQDYIFELNNAATRLEIKTLIDSYMEGIKGRNGVYDFYTVCDDTNNTDSDIENNRLNVHLFLKPTQAAEFIFFTPVVTRFGLDFSQAFGSV